MISMLRDILATRHQAALIASDGVEARAQ